MFLLKYISMINLSLGSKKTKVAQAPKAQEAQDMKGHEARAA